MAAGSRRFRSPEVRDTGAIAPERTYVRWHRYSATRSAVRPPSTRVACASALPGCGGGGRCPWGDGGVGLVGRSVGQPWCRGHRPGFAVLPSQSAELLRVVSLLPTYHRRSEQPRDHVSSSSRARIPRLRQAARPPNVRCFKGVCGQTRVRPTRPCRREPAPQAGQRRSPPPVPRHRACSRDHLVRRATRPGQAVAATTLVRGDPPHVGVDQVRA